MRRGKLELDALGALECSRFTTMWCLAYRDVFLCGDVYWYFGCWGHLLISWVLEFVCDGALAKTKMKAKRRKGLSMST